MSLGKFVRSAKSFLNGLNIKAPWKYTGINSTFEYQDYVLPAETYRTPSPASSPKTWIVPDAEPEHVLDINYHSGVSCFRKLLPESLWGVDRLQLAAEKEAKAGNAKREDLQGKPFMKVYKGGKLVAITDDGEDGGYAR